MCCTRSDKSVDCPGAGKNGEMAYLLAISEVFLIGFYKTEAKQLRSSIAFIVGDMMEEEKSRFCHFRVSQSANLRM